MDYLAEAKQKVQNAWYSEQDDDTMRQDAAIYAAIAQAEQLTRVADYLENISGAYTEVHFGDYPHSVAKPT